MCLSTDSALGKNNKVVKSNTRNYSTYFTNYISNQ